MSLELLDSELLRVKSLRKNMNIRIDEYLQPGYEGVALHSSSILIATNPAAQDMFGYSEEEMLYMNGWRLFSNDSVEAIMRHLTTKSEEAYIVTGVRKNKTHFEVELKGVDFECCGEPVRCVQLRCV